MIEANEDLLAFRRGDKGVVVINKSSRSKVIALNESKTLTSIFSGAVVEAGGALHIEPMSAEVLTIA
ncbi:hypothetical protein JCM19235_5501 [Vibrio maritimus]|uniref:Uncharacterized protein n=1 Tax=Vibrio maritimus TaxID=990268 RepID=A0A090SBN8_9VIBR|nr:hypothetical protein JCM19235_5501 [Vibrio maritimus]